MAETYSKAVSSGMDDDLNSVKPIFLLESDMFGPKPSDKDFLLHHELYKMLGKIIPSSHLRGLQRVRGLWRIYTECEDDSNKLMISGIVVRDRLINFYSRNPRYQTNESPDHLKVRVKDIPCSADDGQINLFLEKSGCNIHKSFRERLRIDGLLTNCLSGDRIFYCDPLESPLPRQVTIGKYRASIFHKGQPPKNRDNIICKKCLEKGHIMNNCSNDWKCNQCHKSGHKQSECDESFSDTNQDDTESTKKDEDKSDTVSDSETENDEGGSSETQNETSDKQFQHSFTNQSQIRLPHQQQETLITEHQQEMISQTSQSALQPSASSIVEENDTDEAKSSKKSKPKSKSGKKNKQANQFRSEDENQNTNRTNQSSMHKFLVEKPPDASTPSNKTTKRSATTPTTDLFDRENQTTKPKT